MPGKQGGDDRVDTGTIKRIWSQVAAKDWLYLLRTNHPDSRWSYNRNIIKGKCPFHDDRDPSFILDLSRQHAKCFSTDCGKFFWDPVRFYMEVCHQGPRITYYKALEELKDRFDIKVPKKVLKAIGKQHAHREMKRVIYRVTKGELIDAYAILNNPNASEQQKLRYAYARPTLDYLEKDRQIPVVFHDLPIGILPSELELAKAVSRYCQQEGIDDISDKVKEYLGFVLQDPMWIGALLFFTGSSPQDPCRIKVRRTPLFSAGTFAHTDVDKEIRFIPDDQEKGVGVFGLFGTPPYQPYFASREVKTCYMVEGEFDALSVMARQFNSATADCSFFCFGAGGGAAGSMDLLKNFGFDKVNIIPDKDAPGEKFAGNIMKDSIHIATAVFSWPNALRIANKINMDPDDAIKAHGLTRCIAEFTKPENYLLPYQWALEKAKKDMNALQPDDIRYLTAKAASWGLYVRSKAEQQAYVTELTKTFNINAAQILDEIKSEDENEDAFIERLKDVFGDRLHVLCCRQKGSNYFLQVFDKVTKEIIDLPIGEQNKSRAALEMIFHKDLWKFIRQDVGEPPFLQVDEDSSKPVYLKQAMKAAGYCSQAISRLGEQLPLTSDLEYMNAGLHAITPTADNPGGDFRLYIVNGTQMFRGDFETEDRLEWRDLSGPSDGNHVIWVKNQKKPRRWMSGIESAKDLNRTPKYAIEELYDAIYAIISNGWDFKNHEVTSEFLTAQVMSLAISACVPRQPLLMFTSDQSSGKSNFVGGLVGRTNKPSINIIQPVYFSDNYTAAGVRQIMNHSTLCLCLDEFEDRGGNDRKSMAVRGILHMLRGHANEGGGSAYGTATGEGEEFEFKGPFIGAGIRNLIDPADISRFIIIEMDKKTERDTPETILMQLFGEVKLRGIRRDLPLVMFRHAARYRKAFFEISLEFRDGGGLKYGKLARSREHFYNAMAVMKLCGKDYKKFLHTYFETHEANLERIAHTSLSNDMFSEILSTPAVRLNDMTDPAPKTLHTILSGSTPTQVNDASCGLYFDKETSWLVVHWATAKVVFLSMESRSKSPTYLKQQASRNTYHISDDHVEKSGIRKRLIPYMGRNIPLREISVFNVNEFLGGDAIAEVTARRAPATEELDIYSEYKDAIAAKQWPDPPSSKKSHEGGTSKRIGENVTSSGTSTPPDIDDEFNY